MKYLVAIFADIREGPWADICRLYINPFLKSNEHDKRKMVKFTVEVYKANAYELCRYIKGTILR